MKSKIFLFVISIVFSFNLFAENVTIQQAKKVALNFYFEKYNLFEGPVLYDQLAIHSTHVESDGIQNFYYVFHVNKGGFVIVPADDCLSPVLGYSFKHNFVADNQPPNVKWWFGQFEEQVRYVRQKKLTPEIKTADQWAYYLNDGFELNKPVKSSKAVEPLLTTEWDQGWPYNYYCPETPTGGSGGHTWVGCVATAIAQITYYWRWPDHGQGYTSYISTVYPATGVQSADFENTWYRYSEMVDEPQTVNLAIAEYSYHIAVGIHMNFSGGGSFPSTDDSIAYYLKLQPYDWYYRDNMPVEQWKELLTTSLDSKFPVYYGGNPSSGSGHAFVCDGYQDEDHFHFNLGWGGQSNGYYTIDNIQGYNYDQDMVPNICPDSLQFTYPQYCSGMDTCLSFEGSITDGSGPIHNYLNNTQASWLIDPQTEYDSVTNIVIMVKRFDLFNDGDRLYIYDGEDNTAPLLVELSGSTIPGDIESTGNKVFIEFITDDANTAPGFYLNYNCERPDWCSGMTQLTEPAATINDGSGSFYYYNSTTCTWIIDPGITDPLTLHFNYFDTEAENDVLKIIDGVSQELIAEISGYYEEPPGPVTSPSGKMFLAFLSNNSVQGEGWEAWYDINTGLSKNTRDFNFQIIPNPVTSDVQIRFNLQSGENVTIQIFDVVGQKLEYLIKKTLTPGHHSIHSNLGHLPEGIYFCRLQTGNEMVTKKVIKVK
ncbi:MAG: C10 family peptidase [Bacteroidales bacterium]|nr:C10 family peptidase [Bacteroidales bacterium]